MDSKELTKIIYSALDDKKGENIKILLLIYFIGVIVGSIINILGIVL